MRPSRRGPRSIAVAYFLACSPRMRTDGDAPWGDLAGQAKFGPNVEWVDATDYAVDPKRAETFYAAIGRDGYPHHRIHFQCGRPDARQQSVECLVVASAAGHLTPEAFRRGPTRLEGLLQSNA